MIRSIEFEHSLQYTITSHGNNLKILASKETYTTRTRHGSTTLKGYTFTGALAAPFDLRVEVTAWGSWVASAAAAS